MTALHAIDPPIRRRSGRGIPGGSADVSTVGCMITSGSPVSICACRRAADARVIQRPTLDAASRLSHRALQDHLEVSPWIGRDPCVDRVAFARVVDLGY